MDDGICDCTHSAPNKKITLAFNFMVVVLWGQRRNLDVYEAEMAVFYIICRYGSQSQSSYLHRIEWIIWQIFDSSLVGMGVVFFSLIYCRSPKLLFK